MELYDYIMQPETVNRQERPQFNHTHPLGHYYQDRYPFPTPDTNLWLALFWIIDPIDRRLAEILEYLRAVGAYLVPDQQYGYRIQPIVGPKGWSPHCGKVDPSKNQEPCDYCQNKCYERERQYMMPHINTILQALGDLRRRYDAGKI